MHTEVTFTSKKTQPHSHATLLHSYSTVYPAHILLQVYHNYGGRLWRNMLAIFWA